MRNAGKGNDHFKFRFWLDPLTPKGELYPGPDQS